MGKHRKPSNTKRNVQKAAIGTAAFAIAAGAVPVPAYADDRVVGSFVVAPVEYPVIEPVSTPEVSPDDTPTAEYTVVEGDWLAKIAPQLGTTWEMLYEQNAATIGPDPDLIVPGQVFFVGGLPLANPPVEVEAQVGDSVPAPEVLGQAIISNSAGPVSARTQAAANAVFTYVRGAQLITIGGTRASARDPHGHPSGNALDYMVMSDAALGDAIVQYNIDHWSELGVEYIIWQQKIMTSPGGGWQWMEDRGSVTQNHYDHVHVNYN